MGVYNYVIQYFKIIYILIHVLILFYNIFDNIIKYENLSNCGNLWIIIHIDINIFLTLRRRPINKIT